MRHHGRAWRGAACGGGAAGQRAGGGQARGREAKAVGTGQGQDELAGKRRWAVQTGQHRPARCCFPLTPPCPACTPHLPHSLGEGSRRYETGLRLMGLMLKGFCSHGPGGGTGCRRRQRWNNPQLMAWRACCLGAIVLSTRVRSGRWASDANNSDVHTPRAAPAHPPTRLLQSVPATQQPPHLDGPAPPTLMA